MSIENKLDESKVIDTTATLTPEQQARRGEFLPLKAINRVDYGNLDDAVVDGESMVTTYWTPVDVGEFRRGTLEFFEINDHEKIDDVTGEFSILQLPVMVLLSYTGNKKSRISNGSKRLVATLENLVKNGSVEIGVTPIQITYLEK